MITVSGGNKPGTGQSSYNVLVIATSVYRL